MKLAIFDVDGTLVRSVAIDASCYVRALAESLGIQGVDEQWVAASPLSDSGIMRQLFRERFGREPRRDEVGRMRSRFTQLLSEASYEEVPGAREGLLRLPAEGWAVGIATGGWRDCALTKLSRAGIEIAGLPAAFAEDGDLKVPIIEATCQRAGGPFTNIVYFGDGPGDLSASKTLGIAFVAVGRPLLGSSWIPDYTDWPRVTTMLAEVKAAIRDPEGRAAPQEAAQRRAHE